ncbi:MAG: glutathione S-transferase C-terminal domain-containing protein, partial [Pseudomonadota bacterium]
MALKPQLITLLPSSGVDLGRWLFAHYGVKYQERPHAPIFHVLALKYWGFGPNEYPLMVKGNTKIPTNEKILPWLEEQSPDVPPLWPDKEKEPELFKEVEELVKYAYWKLGGDVVNWSYWNFLKYKWVVWPSVATKVPWYEKLTLLIAFPVIRALMYKGLKLDQSVADAALKEIREGWDKFDKMLEDGREYLVGGRLTYADLAVSAGLAP